MIDDSLRDIFHTLMGKVQIIGVATMGFAYLHEHYPENINSSTKNKQLKILQDVQAYYKKVFERLDLTSKVLSKTIASREWVSAKDKIENGLKEIRALLDAVENMSGKISDANYNEDILCITKKMNMFQRMCEAISQVIEDFKKRLISLGIYDYVYDDNGKIVIKILSCNFNKETNISIKDYFERKGFIVYTASEGDKAHQIIQAKRPQIAYLSDKLHDSVSGLEVLEEIRQIGYATKVIITTASSLDKIKKELKAKNLYADEVMANPFVISELEKKITIITDRGD